MMNFSEWLDNKDRWIDLYLYLSDADDSHLNKGIFSDPNYHENLIKKLRTLGLGQDANDLEMIKMSQSDISTGLSNRPVSQDKRISFKAAYNTYIDHIEDLQKKVARHIEEKGWKKDLESAFDKKFPNDFYGEL